MNYGIISEVKMPSSISSYSYSSSAQSSFSSSPSAGGAVSAAIPATSGVQDKLKLSPEALKLVTDNKNVQAGNQAAQVQVAAALKSQEDKIAVGNEVIESLDAILSATADTASAEVGATLDIVV